MSRFSPGATTWINSAATKSHIQLLGNPLNVIIAVFSAIIAGVGTARYVAITDSYLAIQYALPTYDGSVGAWFYVGGGILLALAVASSAIKAGLLPTITVASAPVVGWAATHFMSPITPHYAITFPLEMALLYGGLFGVIGYFLGTTIRRGAQTVV